MKTFSSKIMNVHFIFSWVNKHFSIFVKDLNHTHTYRRDFFYAFINTRERKIEKILNFSVFYIERNRQRSVRLASTANFGERWLCWIYGSGGDGGVDKEKTKRALLHPWGGWHARGTSKAFESTWVRKKKINHQQKIEDEKRKKARIDIYFGGMALRYMQLRAWDFIRKIIAIIIIMKIAVDVRYRAHHSIVPLVWGWLYRNACEQVWCGCHG